MPFHYVAGALALILTLTLTLALALILTPGLALALALILHYVAGARPSRGTVPGPGSLPWPPP